MDVVRWVRAKSMSPMMIGKKMMKQTMAIDLLRFACAQFFNEDHQPICFSGSDRTETTTSETCSFVTFSSYAQLTRDLRKSTIADIQTWGQKRVYSLCC